MTMTMTNQDHDQNGNDDDHDIDDHDDAAEEGEWSSPQRANVFLIAFLPPELR